MKLTTLFILSGDKEKLKSHINKEVASESFSEKEFLNINSSVKRFKKASGEIIIGTKILSLQRYRFILKSIMFLSGKSHGVILDESGKREEYSRFEFLFSDSFKFLFELIASAVILSLTFIDLIFKKSNLKSVQN